MSSPLLSIRGLTVTYSLGRRRGSVTALQNVDLDVAPGRTVAVVGESGSGKSTLGNAILGVVPATAGTITFSGEDITRAGASRRRELTKDIQVVFQDPFGSLNPMRTIGQTLEEPLLVHGSFTRRQRADQVGSALARVGLAPPDAARYPSSFSGGQAQRIAIARALLLHSKLIVCDEAVSALDLSVQAQILNLLSSLQKEFGLAYLFISHDMAVVQHLADRVLVLYQGRTMEAGPTKEICEDPQHPYTRRLFEAAPVPDPFVQRTRRLARAAQLRAGAATTGCPFRLQCPHASEVCASPPTPRSIGGRTIACHNHSAIVAEREPSVVDDASALLCTAVISEPDG
jgi:peptide/nickel transport system ATP-binding protein